MFADASGKKPELKEKDWEHLQKLENLYHEIQRDGECVSLKTLAVNGRDLMEHGVQSGKNMGQVLNRLLEHVLEKPEDNQKEILLNLLGEISAQIK
jgi:tRNA nucleotidyltransferase (CCA-adding enzyme)